MYHTYLLQIHVLPSPVNTHLYASEIQKIWLIIFVNAKDHSQERIVTKVSNLSKLCLEVMARVKIAESNSLKVLVYLSRYV